MNGPYPINHGTTAGFRNHFRRGVPMCEPCREAERVRKGIVKRNAPALPMLRPDPAEPRALEEWREQAACLNHPRLLPAAWDDGSDETAENGVTRGRRVAAAVAVCWNECPVREQCLADVDWSADEGIRGGHDLRDMRELRKRGRSA